MSHVTHYTTCYNRLLLYQEASMQNVKKTVRIQLPINLALLREIQRYYVVILVGGK